MSDTGAGHRASAQALQAAFAARFPGRFQVEIVDLWTDYTPWPVNRLPRLYAPVVDRALWLWKLLWAVFENERALPVALRLIYLLCRNDLRKLLPARRPDLIISVHPLMQHLSFHLLDEEGARIPFVTVVTDLASFHRGWFHARAERCFVASQAAAAAARRHGLRAGRIRLLGLPLRAAFAETLPERETARARLGLTDAGFTALLVGGGEGMGPLAAIARAVARRLATTGTDAQLVVICGRNERLRQELQRAEWPLPVQIHGFVDNMQEWMTASDCIITKGRARHDLRSADLRASHPVERLHPRPGGGQRALRGRKRRRRLLRRARRHRRHRQQVGRQRRVGADGGPRPQAGAPARRL